ncbi:hypothetical protein AQJ11_42050 [Streptomyces corchorusii]|uniref:Uncharacterized protein n=2 Tax=Streptomyces TaxID=1883 RepID=A0A101PQP7_STRCK|nr:hypothetical protein AQJ11_42050 [Streptomyces corchorusii]
MAAMTFTLRRRAAHRRFVGDQISAVCDEQPSWRAGSSTERAWSDDTQVWNWAESAVLSGYGPTAASFA